MPQLINLYCNIIIKKKLTFGGYYEKGSCNRFYRSGYNNQT